MARPTAPCCEIRFLVLHTYPDGIKAYGQEWITRGVSSAPDAPHRLWTHRKKRRAGHLQDRPWSRADARRVTGWCGAIAPAVPVLTAHQRMDSPLDWRSGP